jgi:uracil-DNA glycosylase family 4
MSPVDPKPDCKLCPRLAKFRADTARAFPDWHNAPVPSFGSLDARFLIVGLAPGLRGANRTGRSFTGDQSGQLLFATLNAHNFTRGEFGNEADDGLQLVDTMITNAVRCVPPENRPTGAEANSCRGFLRNTIEAMPNLTAVLALGTVAHANILRAVGTPIKSTKFTHNARHPLRIADRPIMLFNSYHCSRYNVNTRRLTPEMFSEVFAAIRSHLGSAHSELAG